MTESLVARGRVLVVHADDDAVTIECDVACPGCRCGRFFGSEKRRVKLPLGRGPWRTVGSTLAIRLPESEFLRVSLWVYGAPWLAMLVGTMVGAATLPGDVGALLGAVVGLTLGVMVLTLSARVVTVPHLEVSVPE